MKTGRAWTVVFVSAWLALLGGCSGSGAGSGAGADACRRTTANSSGPGDASDHFPVAVGARWLYEATASGGSLPGPRTSRVRVDVTGTRAIGNATATVFTATLLDGSAPVEEALFAKDASGVSEFAGAAVAPPLDHLYPYQVIAFPLAPGSSFEQISCTGLDFGSDLDSDGKNERLDVASTVSVVGVESVTVPAGRFDAMRIDTVVTFTVHGTRGRSAVVQGTESVWYAPGVGRVRSSEKIGSGASASTEEDILIGYAVEGRRAGFTQFATLASDLAGANSDTETPGRAALSFHGSGHLLVANANPSGAFAQDSLRAYVVGADGAVSSAAAVTDRLGYGSRPAAAFNGVNHLVASNLCANDCGTVLAQRVTPAGAPLDGTSGFDLAAGPTTAYWPAVASDGDGWLVAWSTFQDGIHAARISAAGAILGAFGPRAASATTAPDPAVALAFGGGVYLLAWTEAQQVLAARIDPGGAVLDDPPLTISTAPGAKIIGGVAFDGSRFLVVWNDARRGDPTINGPAVDVFAARVATDGTLVDGPPATGGIVVNAFPGKSKLDPVVAFDGARCVITWWLDGFTGDVGIFAARVDVDGALVDGPASGLGLPIARPVAFASRFVHPVVAPAAGGESFFEWVDNTELSGATKSIRGAWFAW